jgi:hypothetical protein
MTSAQEASDMNSQDKQEGEGVVRQTTRFMPARKAGKKGSTRCGAVSWRP